MIIVREALAERGKSLVGMRVVIQGFWECSGITARGWASKWPVKGQAESLQKQVWTSQPQVYAAANRKRIAGFPGENTATQLLTLPP